MLIGVLFNSHLLSLGRNGFLLSGMHEEEEKAREIQVKHLFPSSIVWFCVGVWDTKQEWGWVIYLHHRNLMIKGALTAVAQWIECCSVNQNVPSLIPSQGTWLRYGLGPWLGVCEKLPINVFLAHWCFSHSLSSSFPLSLKINKISFKKKTRWKRMLCPGQVPYMFNTWSTAVLTESLSHRKEAGFYKDSLFSAGSLNCT